MKRGEDGEMRMGKLGMMKLRKLVVVSEVIWLFVLIIIEIIEVRKWCLDCQSWLLALGSWLLALGSWL